jgi:hypothetical protein
VVDAAVDSRIPNEEIVRDGTVRAGCVGVDATTVLELAACVRLHWLEDGVVDNLNACRKRPGFPLTFSAMIVPSEPVLANIWGFVVL